ncbi:MAG: 5-(carboxyamino)imidazole ribonucleotide synthase [Chloroflexota bacterium]
MMVRVGILGGGQLAQMMTQAAVSLGVETAIFERIPDSPAARLTHHNVAGDWQDADLLRQFAGMCDLITLENEFVDAGVLDQLAGLGVPVYPTGSTLRLIQDKLIQKQTMQRASVPVPAFEGVDTPEQVIHFADAHGWPVVLKARRNGYDGYGNATVENEGDLAAAWERFRKEGRALLVEAFVPYERELAVMVLRTRAGTIHIYPVVETIQQNHICHVVRAPAGIDRSAADHAVEMASAAVQAVDGVGIFGVELFQQADGGILYNEMAPRPHNSGHYTIEACVTSQFENHLRAVLGWPVGDTALVAPAAVMVNVLGSFTGPAPTDAARAALAEPGAHVHVYAKRDVRVGRKMGHVTVLADTLDGAEAAARRAAQAVAL